jgi:Fe-S cluster assembly protein SufD
MDRLSTFQALQGTLPGAGLPWLDQHRRESLAAFSAHGFPTTRDEEWQYLPASSFSGTQFQIEGPEIEDTFDQSLKLPGCLTLVFKDGQRIASDQSPLPQGLEILNLQDALLRAPEDIKALLELPEPASRHSLSQLVAALAGEGVLIRVAAGIRIEQPIQILHLNSRPDHLSVLRHFIRLERNAEATVIETHAGPNQTPYLALSMTRIRLEENASLDHYKHQCEGDQGRHFGGIYADQAPTSRFRQTQAALGSAIARTEIHSRLERASECELEGVFLAQDRAQLDTHTRLRHAGPHATSRDDYRGIAGGRGRGVFQGRIIVEPGAQKTKAEMQCRNLLLSQDAEIDAKPQLEIHADDVKCSHGLTVGQLDPGAIFYLASRGVGEDEARRLLTYGFANEIVERIRPDALRQRIQDELGQRLTYPVAGSNPA